MISHMIPNETNTLACVLRIQLERDNPDVLVTCTHQHPLDEYIRVVAPSKHAVRTSLLHIRDMIQRCRLSHS